jgi:hypothetical protein
MEVKIIKLFYNAARRQALRLVETRARAILATDPELHEFIMAMGIWTFTRKHDGETMQTRTQFDSVRELIDEWDEVLKLTGEPMRFTAKGHRRRTW